MIIPIEQLSADTLNSIIEDFILREGTEYGLHEVSQADKISQVKAQLRAGSAILVFSDLHQTVNIIPADQFTHNV